MTENRRAEIPVDIYLQIEDAQGNPLPVDEFSWCVDPVLPSDLKYTLDSQVSSRYFCLPCQRSTSIDDEGHCLRCGSRRVR